MQENSLTNLPRVIVRMQHTISMEAAILQPSKINYLKNNNLAELEFLLGTMLELVAEQFNVKNDFTALQIDDTLLTIIAERDFGQLSPEEILYVFRCAKTGKYGPVYNKLDCITICGWLRTYMEGERMDFFKMHANSEPTRRENETALMLGICREVPREDAPLLGPATPPLMNIKDQEAARLRARLRIQMEEFREKGNLKINQE